MSTNLSTLMYIKKKQCTTCKEHKPLIEFHIKARTPKLRYDARCSSCKNPTRRVSKTTQL